MTDRQDVRDHVRNSRRMRDVLRGSTIALVLSGAVLLAGCHARQGTPDAETANATATAKPSSPWEESEGVDPMTDQKTYSIVTEDKAGQGRLHIFCANKALVAIISSDLFLAAGERGSIETRFDDEKATTANGLLHGKEAILAVPANMHSRSIPIEQYLDGMSGQVFFVYGSMKGRHRLRVRLRSFDGQMADLDFNIEGFGERVGGIERKCGLSGYLGDQAGTSAQQPKRFVPPLKTR